MQEKKKRKTKIYIYFVQINSGLWKQDSVSMEECSKFFLYVFLFFFNSVFFIPGLTANSVRLLFANKVGHKIKFILSQP